METKRLELLLLAGCSCLLTLLCQPISHAVATPAARANLGVEASAQVHGTACPADFQRRVNAKRQMAQP
ncbi:hypothetical protein [Myxacorys almedinensis]|uniref:Secreted protein n=1 Tax=Myxacorys almedinensis A TaxID=2690445 RepID=A0A8J8CIW4_9CYAN|nr:hypothetical protein [Myxacorys almedinensis]NDJ18363.1 hypothetical protein [Myxacorys almedinensis A]